MSESTRKADQGHASGLDLKILARECGDCTACCQVMGVSAIGKAPRSECPHVSCLGCGIYASRPDQCRDFVCMWVADARGLFDDEMRPDRIGLIMTTAAETRSDAQVVDIYEVWTGAAESPSARRLIEFLGGIIPIQMHTCPSA